MDRSFEIIEKDNGVFDAFALKNEDGHILQTFAWAGVKKCWKPYGVLAYDETGAVCGTLLLLYRKLPLVKSGILYAPRGPIFGGDRAALLERLTVSSDRKKKFDTLRGLDESQKPLFK